MTNQKRTVAQSVFDSKAAKRIAKEAHRLACEDLAKLHPSQLDIGNPNHPLNDGIFGHDRNDFLKKQY